MGTQPREPTGAPAEWIATEPLDELVPLLYDELREVARRQIRRRGLLPGVDATLTTTGLVSEAYLKIAAQTRARWRDRAHFLGVAAVAMRQILVDHARRRVAAKRGGVERPVTLDTDVVVIDDQARVVIEVNDALLELESLNPRLARVVELRFFGGLSEDDVADVLGVNVRTVQRDWVKARMLLLGALEHSG